MFVEYMNMKIFTARMTPPKKNSELIFISYLEYLFPNFDFKNLKKFCQEAWDIGTRLDIKLRTLLSMSKRGTERKQ